MNIKQIYFFYFAGMRFGNKKKGGKSADDIASANGFLFGPFLVGDLKGGNTTYIYLKLHPMS